MFQMPHKAKTHNDMQPSVCVLCLRKPKTSRPVSKAAFELIEKLIFPDVKSDKWSWLPTRFCGGFVQELQTVYEEKIKDFSRCYSTLNISVHLKVSKS